MPKQSVVRTLASVGLESEGGLGSSQNNCAADAQDKHAELWRDVAMYLPAMVLPRLTGLITLPIVTRLFSPDVFGMYMLVLANIAVLNSATMTGLGAAILRFLPTYENDQASRDGFLFTMLVGGSGIAIVAGGVGYLILKILLSEYPLAFQEVARVGLLLFVVTSIFTLISLVLRSRRMVGVFSVAQLLTNYGGLGIGLVLILIWHVGISGLLWGNIVATGLAVLPCWLIATGSRQPLTPQFSLKHLRRIASFAVFVSLGNAAYWLLTLSDRWLLEVFRSTYEVGIYSASYDLTGKTTQLLITAFALALQPMTTTVWEKQGKHATERLIGLSTRSFILLILPATVGLSILADPILRLLTSPAYTPGAIVVPFVAFSMFLYGLLDLAARGLTLAKRPDIEARNLATAGFVKLVLNLILIPMYGYIAAATTTLVGYICLTLLHARSVRPYIEWRFPWRTLWKAVVACGTMSVVVVGLHSAMVNVNLIFRLLTLGVIGALVYIICLALIKEVSLRQLADFLPYLRQERPRVR